MWRLDITTGFDRFVVDSKTFMVTLYKGEFEQISFPLSDLRVVTFTHRDVEAVTVILDCGLQMSFGGGGGNARNLLAAILAIWSPPKPTLLPA